MDDITKIFIGLLSIGFGVILFSWISKETKKKNGKFNVYDFNVYFFSVLSVLFGLIFVCIGIANLI